MSEEGEVYCEQCRFYHSSGEMRVSIYHVEGRKELNDGTPWPPGGDVVSEGFGITMCQHELCFRKKRIKTVVSTRVIKERIQGQGQLNKDNNCDLFEPNMITRIKRYFKRS